MSRKPHGARRHIPLPIRLLVIERQLRAAGIEPPRHLPENNTAYLKRCRSLLFGNKVNHLHHRPALENRPKDPKTGDTIPPANDPGTLEHPHLIYLEAGEPGTAHYVETYVRGIGAQRSDASQRRYLTRVEKNREKKPAGKKARAAPIRGLTFQQQACNIGARCFCNRQGRKRCGNYRPNQRK